MGKNYLKGLLSLQNNVSKFRNATEKLPPKRGPPQAKQRFNKFFMGKNRQNINKESLKA